MAPPRADSPLSRSATPTRAYLRLLTEDRPGVLADVAGALAAERISIASMHQPSPGVEGEAQLIFLLHRSEDAALREATERLSRLAPVRRLCSCLRLLD